jgi:hypothetical protein
MMTMPSATTALVSASGLNSTEPLQAVLAQEPDTELSNGSAVDVVVLGRDAKNVGRTLSALRYRKGRKTPFAVLPANLPNLNTVIAGLDIPYIVYGTEERAHIRLKEMEGCSFVLETPVGDARVNLECAWDELECLAAIGAGLALRIPLETLISRLENAAASKVRPVRVYHVRAA